MRNLLEETYNKFNLQAGEQRRDIIRSRMNSLKGSNINCFSCTGLCCTFQANSMRVDLVEGLELYWYLKSENRINSELFTQLEQCIDDFRLDYHLDTGGGQGLRRTYTCPFFSEGSKGCSVSPSSKPYGCLGFNAKSEGVSAGEDCASDQELLDRRERAFEENEREANNFLKFELGIIWEKESIPRALLDLHEALIKRG